eukprot:1161038-Pelagomonas_calceolata.AAC.4
MNISDIHRPGPKQWEGQISGKLCEGGHASCVLEKANSQPYATTCPSEWMEIVLPHVANDCESEGKQASHMLSTHRDENELRVGCTRGCSVGAGEKSRRVHSMTENWNPQPLNR